MNFNSQKQFHIDPACIRESSFLISFVMVQEISLSSQFQHKHIVQYYGTFKGKAILSRIPSSVNDTDELIKSCGLVDSSLRVRPFHSQTSKKPQFEEVWLVLDLNRVQHHSRILPRLVFDYGSMIWSLESIKPFFEVLKKETFDISGKRNTVIITIEGMGHMMEEL
ncbi:hypothetical protein CK203_103206 [Vitis vinifera]|uniref:Uncharacterized protein n=1 Tax=Vitis vinifera TaxID=29760 RepID=A0A438FHC4_VITVI|nr:hypothetical protein CK203_103206 [Vitis vinifera]